MLLIRVALALLCVVGGMPAALKPIDTDLQPVENKAVATYKTTPQGDLKVNLYFPPGRKSIAPDLGQTMPPRIDPQSSASSLHRAPEHAQLMPESEIVNPKNCRQDAEHSRECR
jgi:hypothetical protein